MASYPQSRRNPVSRRNFLRLAGMAGGGALLASCAPKATPTQKPTEPAVEAAPTEPPPAQEKLSLSFWTPGGSDVFCKGFGTIAEEYEKLTPNIDIGEAQCNPSGENFNEMLMANIAAATPPDTTIIWTSPAAFAARGALEALDDLMAVSKYSQLENWPAGVLASCQYRGKTYGLPATAGTYAIFYNQEMFEAKGIPSDRESFPKTWDEMRRLSKEFVKWDGDVLQSAGYIPWGIPGDTFSSAVEFAFWSAVNGSQLFDAKNLKYTIDSEQNIYTMQYALDWWDEQYKGDLTKVRTSANWGGYSDGEGRPPAFQENKLAMQTNGYWFTTDMYAVEMKFERWDVASVPVGPNGKKTASGYWPNWLVIPKGTKHVTEAFAYLDYMTVDGIKIWYNNIPDLPANKKTDPNLVPKTVVEKRGQELAASINTFFHQQLDVATPMWDSPVQDFFLDQLSRAIEQILGRAASPKDALGEAQKACQAELDKVLSS